MFQMRKALQLILALSIVLIASQAYASVQPEAKALNFRVAPQTAKIGEQLFGQLYVTNLTPHVFPEGTELAFYLRGPNGFNMICDFAQIDGLAGNATRVVNFYHWFRKDSNGNDMHAGPGKYWVKAKGNLYGHEFPVESEVFQFNVN